MNNIQTEAYIERVLKNIENMTGISRNTIFPVLSTLFVFGLGILTNWIISFLKERNQRRNYKRTINLLLNNLGEICRKQSQLTSKALQGYSILDNKKIAIKMHVYSPLFFLNKMDYSLFINYYVRGCYNRKLKIKASTKVFQIIGFTNIFETDNQEKLKYFLDTIGPYQEIYIKNVVSLESFGKNISTLEVIDYDFKKSCADIFRQWSTKNTNNNFTNSFANLISPLKSLLDVYTMEPASPQLQTLIHECHQAYSDIVHMDVMMLEHFKTFAFENRRVYKQIEVILKIFNFKQ